MTRLTVAFSWDDSSEQLVFKGDFSTDLFMLNLFLRISFHENFSFVGWMYTKNEWKWKFYLKRLPLNVSICLIFNSVLLFTPHGTDRYHLKRCIYGRLFRAHLVVKSSLQNIHVTRHCWAHLSQLQFGSLRCLHLTFVAIVPFVNN